MVRHKDDRETERLGGRSQEAYVAFAFAAADLLLETDSEGRIVFAVGASMALVGRPARLLAQTTLTSMVQGRDRTRLKRALKRMAGGSRVRHVLLTVDFPNGEAVPVALSGYPHPDRNGRLLCVLAHSGGLVAPMGSQREAPLLDRRGLADMAGELVAEGEAADVRLTMLDMPELQTLRERLGAERTAEFVEKFTEHLRQNSVDGNTAAELGDDKFGLLHTADVTPESLTAAMAELASTVAGQRITMSPKSVTITLDAEGMSSQEAARALAYTISRFAHEEGQTIENIALTARPHLAATVAQMRDIKRAIDGGEFELLAQPIIDLWTGVVHHFECLLRFRDGASPYDTVTFAENLGLACELDVAVCTRAIELMRTGAGAP